MFPNRQSQAGNTMGFTVSVHHEEERFMAVVFDDEQQDCSRGFRPEFPYRFVGDGGERR